MNSLKIIPTGQDMLNNFRIGAYFLFMIALCPLLLFGEDLAIEEQTSRFTYEFFKMIALLVAMVLLMLFVSWYVKRLGVNKIVKTNQENLIKIIEQRTLSQRSVIYLLEIDGKSLVVGETPHGLVRLSEKLDS